MPAKSPSERKTIARIAALEGWAATPDRAARTAPGRAALLARFESEVDPDGVLSPTERARRAEFKRRAHYQRLALKSAQSRRKAKELLTVAESAEAELASGGDAA